MNRPDYISEETLMRYLAGTASLDEVALITSSMKDNPEFRQEIEILEGLPAEDLSFENNNLPMTYLAAASEDNLCDILCEQYILKHYVHTFNTEDLVDAAAENQWLQEEGTPLHNIGRLLEKNGVTVRRNYDGTLAEIAAALSKNKSVIAVVDYGRLLHNEQNAYFHAVVCLSVNPNVVTIYDPAMDDECDYPAEDFQAAWDATRNYMVCAAIGDLEYDPRPLSVDDIDLDSDLLDLTEAIAEDVHEVWALGRKAEGWTYGEQRDDVAKKHPDLVPYARLTEGEKQYDRDVALHTIRLVKKLGYKIGKPGAFRCPSCGAYIDRKMNFCPQCGEKIDQEVFYQ